MLLRILLMLCCYGNSFAADKTSPNRVYNHQSQLTVQNINKTVEVLRDPSKMTAGLINKASSAIKGKTTDALSTVKSATNTKQDTLRDPTQMSGNFRQAIKSYVPANSVEAADNPVALPTITLIGKIIAPDNPHKTATRDNKSSVALNIDGQVIHLQEGDSSSVFKNDQLYTLTVNVITDRQVTIRLQPSNEILILH